mgnify:CR=1 FL=1
MNSPDKETLLAETVQLLRAVEAQLTELCASQAAALKKYAASDNAYREELKRHGAEGSAVRAGQILYRVLAILLLAYIAFQVSR